MRNIRKIAASLAAAAVVAGVGTGVASATTSAPQTHTAATSASQTQYPSSTYWHDVPNSKCMALGMQKTHNGNTGSVMCGPPGKYTWLDVDWHGPQSSPATKAHYPVNTFWYKIPTHTKCFDLGKQKIGGWAGSTFKCSTSPNGYTLRVDWHV